MHIVSIDRQKKEVKFSISIAALGEEKFQKLLDHLNDKLQNSSEACYQEIHEKIEISPVERSEFLDLIIKNSPNQNGKANNDGEAFISGYKILFNWILEFDSDISFEEQEVEAVAEVQVKPLSRRASSSCSAMDDDTSRSHVAADPKGSDALNKGLAQENEALRTKISILLKELKAQQVNELKGQQTNELKAQQTNELILELALGRHAPLRATVDRFNTLQQENTVLTQENTVLTQENSALTQENTALTQENQTLKQEQKQSENENSRLTKKIASMLQGGIVTAFTGHRATACPARRLLHSWIPMGP